MTEIYDDAWVARMEADFARLEAEGLVERLPHASDGRVTLAKLTPKGRRTVAKATELLNAQVFTTLGWSPAQTAEVFRLLAPIRQGVGDFPTVEAVGVTEH